MMKPIEKSPRDDNESCPFYRGPQQLCSLIGECPTARRRQLCCSDEHDRCPVYLTFLLRHSRPQRVDCDWHDVG